MSSMPAIPRPVLGVTTPDREVDFSETAVEGRGGKSPWWIEPAEEVIVSLVKYGRDMWKTWRTGCSCLKVHGAADWLVLARNKRKAEGFQVGLCWYCLPNRVPGCSARGVQVTRIDEHGPASSLGRSGGVFRQKIKQSGKAIETEGRWSSS